MSEIAIRAEGLGKQYQIGNDVGARFRYKSLRDSIAGLFSRPRGLRRPQGDRFFWALQDVSLEIPRGKAVGIVGSNGAGKTTLLKILSRITEPTSGRAEMYGRVGSLLEVGTGFHPELTGRENIYLNGAILGMKKSEIEKRFEEIVCFAGVEKFLDTPVKYFSSGMYVRLAFAVAAYLESEILLVDEVLAVGDLAFQNKCLGKMGQVTKEGRTVLLVSHNMAAILNLCEEAFWLRSGRLAGSGKAEQVVAAYRQAMLQTHELRSARVERDFLSLGGRTFHVSRVELTDEAGNPTTMFRYNDYLNLTADFEGIAPSRFFNLEFRIYNELDQLITVGSSAFHGFLLDNTVKQAKIKIGPLVLTSGKYVISLSLVDSLCEMRFDNWEKCCGFHIYECRPFPLGHELPTRREGVCVLGQSFTQIQSASNSHAAANQAMG